MAAQTAESIAHPSGGQREPSMEEILASIRRIIEDSDTGKPEAATPPPAANSSPAPATAVKPAEVEAFRQELRQPEALPQPSVQPEAPKPSIAAPTPAAPSTAAEVDIALDENFAEIEPITASLPAEAPRSTIISEVAGRQVAAAFGELSDAFAATRRRSFDEMAEDMIRPMLQDWLDNNLPTLVEKLVREEIERIARGGSK